MKKYLFVAILLVIAIPVSAKIVSWFETDQIVNIVTTGHNNVRVDRFFDDTNKATCYVVSSQGIQQSNTFERVGISCVK